ncbi:hypothetical protein AYY19_12440 [Photobacterium aquimaris]|uniref:Uncharacterized protein n=1 Tax=Photobacterium aquimaris TaxID=512643 RepID=A0A2T3II71_9GAMM|nr:hypothetical protein [Photobacterium aquimaris]OBU17694.1 hypothetical protein AYY19_12440 [Photobacterium aquimaris]OBU23142.1 hypothetical protein AYY20_11195 [Photobacterium aquimaris]PSU28010.1 hypothetical protein CTM88_13955 [Photobacterium aquimaris]PSV99508.1 hypothetical protein CTM91_14375 [Photobacterium aquimaris]
MLCLSQLQQQLRITVTTLTLLQHPLLDQNRNLRFLSAAGAITNALYKTLSDKLLVTTITN